MTARYTLLACALLVGGCAGTESATSTPTSAQPVYSTEEQEALDALKPVCNDGNDDALLHRRAEIALKDIKESVPLGFNERVVSVLHFVKGAIPEGTPMPCAQIFAIYAAERASGAINAP
jgi:hypothetical protein